MRVAWYWTVIAVGLVGGCGSGTDDAPAASDSMVSPVSDLTQSANSADPVISWRNDVGQDFDAFTVMAMTLDEDCVVLESPRTGGQLLSIWPIGTSWDRSASAVVLADGFTVHVGDVISMGGGAIPLDQLDDNGIDAGSIEGDGFGRLQACALSHPGLAVWLFDSEGGVAPGSVEQLELTTT